MKKRILSFFITACMVLTMFPTSVFAADINTLLNDAAASSSNVEDKTQKEGAESLPDSGTSMPAASSSVPSSGTSTPPVSSSVPNSGTSTPAVSSSVSNSGTSTPATSSSVPNSGTSTPAASSSVPNSGTSTPATSSSVPNSGTSVPAASSSLPSSSMPKISGEEKVENEELQAQLPSMMSGVLAEGTYGGCDWAVGEDNTLTISPTPSLAGELTSGVLPSPTQGNMHNVPWSAYNKQILKVVIKAGVKSGANLNSFLRLLTVCTSIDLSGLDTTAATDMRGMFSFNGALKTITFGDNFDTAAVTKMGSMFYDCKELQKLDLSGFNTEKVTDMSHMFANCNKLDNLILGDNFDTSNVIDMSYMFNGCKELQTLELGENFTTTKVEDMRYMFMSCEKLQNLDLSWFNTANVKDMFYMFMGCKELQTLDLSGFNTANVTNMYSMFYNCAALKTLTLGKNFTTTKVEDMSYMFVGCKELQTLDLSGFNTANVTNMYAMFTSCEKLENLILGNNFDTAAVTNMSMMFSGCKALKTLALGKNFTTTNVENMGGMFNACNELQKLDLSGFNTVQVTDMSIMFAGCEKLDNLNLGENFDTAAVTNMKSMFNGCKELQKLDLSGFNTDNVTNMSNMFNGCKALKALDISSFKIGDSTSITNMLADNTFILKTDYYKKAMNSGTSAITLYDKASKADLTTTDLDGNETNIKYMPQAISADLGDITLTGAMPDADAQTFFESAKVFNNGMSQYIEGNGYAYPGAKITVGAKDSADEIASVTVVKTDDETTKITVTDNAFTMPAYPVTIDVVVKITPTAEDFSFEPATAIYDGKEKPVEIGVGPAKGFGTFTVMYNGSTTAPTDAGTYAITIDMTGTETYNPVKDLSLGDFIIKKAPYADDLTATVEHAKTDKTTKTYDLSQLISGKTEFTEVSYAAGTTAKGNVLTGDATVKGNTLEYTLVGTGSAGDTATVDVSVKSKNYEDITATITIKLIEKTDVTVSGLSAANGTYDGNTQNGYTGTPVAKIGEKVVSIDGYDYTYYLTDGSKTTAANSGAANDGAAPKNAGSYKLVVSVSDSNTIYTGNHTDISFTIAKKPVTITGVKADNKVYDGNVKATTNTDATINGKVVNDDVKPAGGKAVFDNKNVGTGKKVTFSDYTLAGANAANYTLSAQPIEGTADITAATITVTKSDKVKVTKEYDTTTKAGELTGALEFSGKIGEDVVSITATAGVYADADAGDNKAVTLNLALDGTDKGNYKLASDKYDFKAAEITKIDYTGEKAASELIFATGQKGATLTLPELPKGAKYGALTASGDVEMTDLSIKNNALIFTAPKSEDKKTGIVTIKVTDATNYNDYDVVVTITYTAKVNIIWDNQDATTSQIDGSTELNLDDAIVIPTSAPVKTGYAFGGWFTEANGKGIQITATSKAPAKAKVTYYAKWTALKYTITGNVTQENKKPLSGAAVNLIKDGKSIMRTATKPNGEFNIVNVAYGEGYTIKVSKAMYIMQESEKFDLTDTEDLDYEVSFELKELEKIVSGVGENNPFDLSDLTNAIGPEDENVTKIELKVTPAPAVSNEIKAELESFGKANSKTKYYDLTLLKYINNASTAITETNGLVKIVMPIDVDIQGNGAYELLRKHGNNKAEKITTTKNASGEYIEISPTFIVAYLKYFSVYAIQYTGEQAVTPPTPENPSNPANPTNPSNPAKDYLLSLADTGDNSYGGGKMNIGDTVKIYAGTKQGYRFIGWETTNGGILADTTSAETTFKMVNGPCTLIARWVAIEGHSGKKNPATGVGTEVPNNVLSIVLPLALICIGGTLFIARKHKHN